MNILYDSEQNAIAPAEIQRRLKQVDPLLHLEYVKYPNPHDPMGKDKNHWWALASTWREDDKRRKMIQRGEMPEEAAFDILGYLPLDTDVADCYDKVVGILQRQDRHPHVAARELLEQIGSFNRDVQKEALKPTAELAAELIETNAGTLFKAEGKDIPKVFVTDAKHKGR